MESIFSELHIFKIIFIFKKNVTCELKKLVILWGSASYENEIYRRWQGALSLRFDPGQWGMHWWIFSVTWDNHLTTSRVVRKFCRGTGSWTRRLPCNSMSLEHFVTPSGYPKRIKWHWPQFLERIEYGVTGTPNVNICGLPADVFVGIQ